LGGYVIGITRGVDGNLEIAVTRGQGVVHQRGEFAFVLRRQRALPDKQIPKLGIRNYSTCLGVR
jgi:hypothetical protein